MSMTFRVRKSRVISHHLFHPRSRYDTPTAKRFRNLPCCRVQVDEWIEKLYHRLLPDGIPMPSQGDMAEAVRRHQDNDCSCE